MSLRFLIVDDTRFMRIMLTDILQRLEYEVIGEAENGFKGVEMYREFRPDIVFMDISMPEMDGVEALRRIREIDPLAVVIICSAVSQQDLIADAMKHGANGYVMKPFKPKQIKEAVEKYAPLVVRREPVEERESASLLDAVLDAAPIESNPDGEGEPIVEAATDLSLELAVNIGSEVSSEQKLEHEAESSALAFEPQFELEPALEHAMESSRERSDESPSELPEALLPELAEELSPELMSALQLERNEEHNGHAKDRIIEWPSKRMMKHRSMVSRLEEVYSCRWSEEWSGQFSEYKASFAAGEERLLLESSGVAHQQFEISIEALRELLDWADAKTAAKPVALAIERQ